MSYSKIFSDLPELTYDIIKYFKNDFSTLHSCILVNRLWCRLAIPLLWENPFSIPNKNYNFIIIYLHNLNGDLKAQLSKYKIDDKLFPSNTLFNYPTFLKYLYTQKIISSIKEWAKDVKLEKSSILGFKRLIHMSLFKIFILNEVNIHTFDIQINFSYIDDILELMLKNPDFFHNIRNLKLGCIDVLLSHAKNFAPQMIILCQNLKKISSTCNSFPIYQSSLLSKDYNHSSNTLNTIILYSLNFKVITNLDKLFKQLNVLESVHIIYCILSTDFVQKIINLIKPFKLKSIFLYRNNELQFIELLQLLLQKYGDYLENFGFEVGFSSFISEEQQLLESIIKYCKNIKFLDLTVFNSRIIYPLFNLTENLKQNLNHLSIKIFAIEFSSIILQNLGQLLPLKLEYLSLTLIIKYEDFEIFLKNSQNTYIKKLLINYSEDQDEECRDTHDIILFYIKKYIMKKKRIKYLAIISSNTDLSSFKDEVKEFELYNIKIQKYYDLFINSKLRYVEELEGF
ncbi:uncharacterized protein OCT59_026092 [Rhizophagus irregularis]|uniref:F-box domain-containing protein n=3 Tax=Rhizophagus irregularis TaxID=588596 RepID=A0A015IKK9_RHIIW|nr:hypothetical protein GLOIN_2v1787505 [Rhizophagus irregularis DAOM 181602=DAOM 197198]EXX57692.1 hypothetical protein RirG_204780 [Rhizophagus irregularis DAOM 197198w]POG60730.1 hypothetical protein GLOIN_2v1787505 [Rhizophagus irregularis DAOM 181602=DAOM 197198]UZO05752.1 hypothetical protein OCT59_026092 [Rhizophagus irregularis]GBC17371.1 hypothetical protein GLOIN_2v1787505 [Rhizophagus irregularis DAOM 181602=DAOM 197198]|eukprot:XP_025167596.1 hypothetical protein GLOIN_2v1787505 [Rhizophagus irregularis DAOM 181602=DAOM 197198]